MPRGGIPGSYDRCMANKPLPWVSVSFCILTSNAWAFLLLLLRTLSNYSEAFIPFLETSEGEHLFMCLFAICIPFLLKCLLKSLCISYCFFYFPITDFWVCYIYSKYNIFVRYMTYKYFLQYFFIISFFIILAESFEKQNFNLLIKSSLPFFFYGSC